MLRLKKRIHRPCIRCDCLFEKKRKKQVLCPRCLAAAYKKGGETRQKQYKLLGKPMNYMGPRELVSAQVIAGLISVR
jgi:hypothetical protein